MPNADEGATLHLPGREAGAAETKVGRAPLGATAVEPPGTPPPGSRTLRPGRRAAWIAAVAVVAAATPIVVALVVWPLLQDDGTSFTAAGEVYRASNPLYLDASGRQGLTAADARPAFSHGSVLAVRFRNTGSKPVALRGANFSVVSSAGAKEQLHGAIVWPRASATRTLAAGESTELVSAIDFADPAKLVYDDHDGHRGTARLDVAGARPAWSATTVAKRKLALLNRPLAALPASRPDRWPTTTILGRVAPPAGAVVLAGADRPGPDSWVALATSESRATSVFLQLRNAFVAAGFTGSAPALDPVRALTSPGGQRWVGVRRTGGTQDFAELIERPLLSPSSPLVARANAAGRILDSLGGRTIALYRLPYVELEARATGPAKRTAAVRPATVTTTVVRTPQPPAGGCGADLSTPAATVASYWATVSAGCIADFDLAPFWTAGSSWNVLPDTTASVTIESVSTSGSHAVVVVQLYTVRPAPDGCHTFDGRYALARVADGWRMTNTGSHLTRSTAPCG
jgi:hypothetical protein